MTDIVVVGAGLGGLATAARLAKLGHRVTICERGDSPGGLLRRVRSDGFEWDATPFQTTIPAVLRDLFRKSGRPIERYVDLALSTPARRHVFTDGTILDLPTGSRGAQLDAVTAALGPQAGSSWTSFVDRQGDVWEAIRSRVLDVPAGVVALHERRAGRALSTRPSLDRLLHKTFQDARLRSLAAFSGEVSGSGAADEPAFTAVETYVERTFGVWRTANGALDLAAALLTRMSERSVDVRFDSEVTALRTAGDRVIGVTLSDGSAVDADIVIAAVSPRQVFTQLLDHPVSRPASDLFARDHKAWRSSVSYLGLAGDIPVLPTEVVLHGDPLVVVSTTRVADGLSAWAVRSSGTAVADVLDVMATRGLDIGDLVKTRLDVGELPDTLCWKGPRTAAARSEMARPLPGLLCLGTSLVLGVSVPYVAWQAVHVAELIGPERR